MYVAALNKEKLQQESTILWFKRTLRVNSGNICFNGIHWRFPYLPDHEDASGHQPRAGAIVSDHVSENSVQNQLASCSMAVYNQHVCQTYPGQTMQVLLS